MTPRLEAPLARAYLLGAVDERERDLVEEIYVHDADALAMVEAAEDALIEDYLGDRLDGTERDQFDRHYLAALEHRIRVETMRGLSRRRPPAIARLRRGLSTRLIGVAAALVVVATGAVWMVERANHTASSGAIGAGAPPPARRPAAPVTVAFSLTPSAVRGVDETPPLHIPAGVDVVALRLEADGPGPPMTRGRVVIARVAGDEVWRGGVTSGATPPAGVLAAIDVPADRLRPDDYLVTLIDSNDAGAEATRARYVLRVR